MRRNSALLALLTVLLVPSTTAVAAAATQRTSLPDVEDEVMCVSCKIPLNVAPHDSPQAENERNIIRRLIGQGLSKQQIKAALVSQYGTKDVLAMPDGNGFGITAYVIPLALVALLAGALVVLLPRWRRRAPAGIAAHDAPALSKAESVRLDDELARYER